MEIEEISVGNNKFIIKDNIFYYDQHIISRNFSIGGTNTNCVNISITYKDEQPIYANIPYLLHDPDCSVDKNLEKGKGTIIMIKTLLEYIHNKIPSITEFHFEDKSSIESATHEEIQKKSSRFMKKGTNIIPIPLYYFSIAFNGITWYEKHFNARLKDSEKHRLYREKVEYLLYSTELKKNTPFIDFLQKAQPPVIDIIHELEPYYNESKTFGDFFQSIPSKHRIRLVRDWIKNFMMYHLQDVFSNKDWIIKVPITHYTNESVISEKKGGKNGKRKTKKYYCPNVKIDLNPPIVNVLSLRPEDI
jgi:hypothetical protein